MENAEDKKKGQPQVSAALILKGKKKKLPELLAPAGEMSTALGALHAGADAVYLGAQAFSARAYAKNLDRDELITVLDHAHLFGKKVYLTCNILMRREELPQMLEVLDPLYVRGLDGVIVQDLGLLALLHRRYPSLPLHASTQMSILSAKGAEYLRRYGVSRVVPGRELSIEEIRGLKESGMEVECFIHGAMCYSYSGKCLMSSMAGGRSGNRGRCAGTCRQPYYVDGKKPQYLLSMKDMWSLEHLDELMDAGVDSFKIEGRMKAPEYAAGVTAVYRKYMDLYASGRPYRVDKADPERLKSLYMRSERQEGYLHRHNGREMISLDSPAYAKVSEELKEEIRKEYIDTPLRRGISIRAFVYREAPLQLQISCGKISVSVEGETVQAAQKRAVTEEEIQKQLCKTANTDFFAESCVVDTDGASFVAVSVLNALRREALLKLRDKLLPAARTDLRAEESCAIRETQKARSCRLLLGLSELQSGCFEAVAARKEVDGIILELDTFLHRPEHFCKEIGKKSLYLRLPSVLREKYGRTVEERLQKAAAYPVTGIYCGGIDALAYAGAYFERERRIADQGFYVFNPEAEERVLSECCAYTISAEMSGREIKNAIRRDAAELIVYGRTPLMYSANCIYKTTKGCRPDAGIHMLHDEKGHHFPLRPVHAYCYNVIYNCVPLSLHNEVEKIRKQDSLSALRMEFTTEKEEDVYRILDAYIAIMNGERAEFPLKAQACTRGHYNRGAE